MSTRLPRMGRSAAPKPAATRRLTELPSWLVGQASRHANRLVSEALAEEGMRRQHFTVLLALAEHGPSSQAELGRRLWIDRSDLHAVLNDLEQDGDVVRVRDEADRRRNVVELTDAGTKALERLDGRVEAAQEALLEPLTKAQRRELRGLLTLLARHHGSLPGGEADAGS
jgi:MarR family transcriptional regulator, lower aerobic nicotinate degradation pathway regulator